MIIRNIAAAATFGLFATFAAVPALAQGWGEQRPLQFEIVGANGNLAASQIAAGQVSAAYNQADGSLYQAAGVGLAALSSANASGGGLNGASANGQANQNQNGTTALTVSGSGNTINVTQTTTGTSQGAANSIAANSKNLNTPGNTVANASGSNSKQYLNQSGPSKYLGGSSGQ